MIELKNVTKTYGKSNVKAVDDLSMTIPDGTIFGFLGPNGAGKSTTIKCMTGILKADVGSIKICDFDINEQALQAKMNIGYVPDEHTVYERLTGNEYLNFIGDIYKVPLADRKAIIDEYVSLFELKKAIDNPIKSYSHGMKQKISVIGALLHNPKVWILDEPLTGLDPKSAHILKQLMRKHADAGNVVFFSSHVLEVVEKVCDRVAIIKNGKLVAEFGIDELQEKQHDVSLESYFLDITEKNADVDTSNIASSEELTEQDNSFERDENAESVE